MAKANSRKLLYSSAGVSLVVVLLLVVRVAGQGELRAMSVLTRFSDPKTGGFATSFAAHPV